MRDMPTRLDEILAHTSHQVKERKAAADHGSLEKKAMAHTPRGFAARLREVSQSRPAIISEIKKASPSRGLIRDELRSADPGRGVLRRRERQRSRCLPTKSFFRDRLNDLEAASQAVRIPCLRKDFMVDPFQILEARAAGSGCDSADRRGPHR